MENFVTKERYTELEFNKDFESLRNLAMLWVFAYLFVIFNIHLDVHIILIIIPWALQLFVFFTFIWTFFIFEHKYRFFVGSFVDFCQRYTKKLVSLFRK